MTANSKPRAGQGCRIDTAAGAEARFCPVETKAAAGANATQAADPITPKAIGARRARPDSQAHKEATSWSCRAGF